MAGLRGEIVILTHDEALKCWGKVTGRAVKRKVSPPRWDDWEDRSAYTGS